MRLAGVDTGVSRAAAHDTDTARSTGLAATPRSAAADRAMGITISAVAVLLIMAPNPTQITNTPSRSAHGPAPPTMSTRRLATLSAAPLTCMAVETGIIPATSTTVVHETPR